MKKNINLSFGFTWRPTNATFCLIGGVALHGIALAVAEKVDRIDKGLLVLGVIAVVLCIKEEISRDPKP